MIIEISDSNFSFEEGIIIITVEGKSFPYSTKKTIAQLCEDIKTVSILIIEKSKGEVVEVNIKQPDINRVERNDIVKYIGPVPEDNRDLVVDAEYRILNVNKDSYDIISDTSPVPIRLCVLKGWIALIRKNPPPKVNKINTLSTTINCTICGNVAALEKNGDIYTGNCNKCGEALQVKL